MAFLKYLLIFSAIFAEALPTKEISLGDEVLTVEIADTPWAHEEGLMYRTELKDGYGMLFIYRKPNILSFWMKNTLIPLSVAFFDKDKVLLNIKDMNPVPKGARLTNYYSIAPALYALEVPQGWFDEHKIEPGMKFSFRHQ